MNKEKQIRRMVEKFGKFKIVDFSQSLLFFSSIDAYILFCKTRTIRESRGEFKTSYEFNNSEATFLKTLDKELFVYFANDLESLELVVPFKRIHGLFKNLQNDVLVRHRASITFRRSRVEFTLNHAGKINVEEYYGFSSFIERGIQIDDEIMLSNDKLLFMLIQIGIKKGFNIWINTPKYSNAKIESFSDKIVEKLPRFGSEIDDKMEFFDIVWLDNDNVESYWSINQISSLSNYFDLFIKIIEANITHNFNCILPYSSEEAFFAKVNEMQYFDKHLFENIIFYDHNSINKIFDKFVKFNESPIY